MRLHQTDRDQRDQIMPIRPMFRPQKPVISHFSFQLRLDDVAQREQRQRDGQHPVDAHQRAVRVRRGEERPVLEVAHERQVDEEAQHARAEQVPERGGDQEPERGFVRELDAARFDDTVLP
jgi:hypothetical protein